MDIRQFVAMSDEDLMRMMDKPIGVCLYSKCGKPVMSSDEKRLVPSGVYHEDCYFNEWGEEIERNPICNLGRRGIGVVVLDKSDLEVAIK